MRKFKLVIEYEGTRYRGWQVQPNGITVQEVLQNALQKITGRETSVVGSGRTDSGVHAEAQVAHFRTVSKMTPREFLKALNSLLPYDIVIHQVQEVSDEFHAQLSATRKLYRYSILNRDFPSALEYRFTHYIAQPLNVAAMRRAAGKIEGKHDFSCFRGAGCEAKTSIRTIHQCVVKKRGDRIHIEVEGDGFLKHMVRNIAGTLIEVGKGRYPAAQVTAMMESRDRGQAGPTAPARGLRLVWVQYPRTSRKKP